MAFDGRVKFDTSLDKSGLENGLKSAANTAKVAAGAITAAIGTGTAAAIKVGSDFEKAMSSVYAISNATAETAEKLKNAADEAGATTQFSATQSANALEYLALAGYNAEESINALPKVLNLAAAGGLDLAYASDLLTDSMAVMGLGIQDMDNFSDQLAMAASKANTSVAQLGEAVLIAGGQAKLCGMDVAEMNTALGILADKGIKGSEGGTALRNTLKNLYTPTNAAAKELSRLGIVTADAEGNLRPMQDVLMDLNGALSEMTAEEKTKAMAEIFDTRTIAAATALLDDCGDRWNELEGYLRDCDGSAAKMAETLTDNLWGRLEEVSSAAESCGIAFYDAIADQLKVAAEEGASQLQSLAGEMKEGELKEGIEALGSGLGNLTGSAISLARGVLPSLLKTIGFLCENIESLTILTVSSVTAIKGYKILQTVSTWYNSTMVAVNAYSAAVAANSAMEARGITISGLLASTMKAKEVVLALLTGKMKLSVATTALATKAQLAWNAAMQANMVGVVFAGVVALTGVIAALAVTVNKETAEERALRVEREKLVTATGELKQEQEELRDSLNKTLAGLENEASAAAEVAKKVEKLMKVENKSTEQKGQLADAIDILNELMPDLNLSYDEETDAVKDANGEILTNTDLIYKNIEAMKKRAEAEAYKYSYVESLKKQAEAERNLAKAKEAEAEAQKKYNEAMEKSRDQSDAGIMGGMTIIDPKITEELKKAKEAREATQSVYDGIVEDTEYWSDKYEALMYGTAVSAVEGFAKGMTSPESVSIIDSAVTKAFGSVPLMASKKLQINSPAKTMIPVGGAVPEGFALGVEKNADLVTDAVESMADGAIDAARSKAEGFKSAIADALSGGGLPKENAEKATEAYEEQLEVFERQLDAGIITEEQYLKEQEKLRDKHLAKGTKEWLDATQELFEGTKKLEEEAIEEELELLEFRYDTGLITEEDYYKELKRIRDTYFTEDSEVWRKYTEKLVNYEKDKAEDIIDVIEDTTDRIKDAYEDAFDDVNDSIEDMADGLKNVGDFYVTGTVEINGKEVKYSSLVDPAERNKWYEELYNRGSGLKDRLKSIGLTDEEFKSFWEHFGSMGEEGMYEYSSLLLNLSDADFMKQVRGYLEGEGWGKKYADLFYAEEKTEAEEEFIAEIENILTEAGKELPDNFWELGDLSGESFSKSFLDGVRMAIAEAKSEVQTFVSSSGISMGGGGYSATYNFYSSGQTVSEQLTEASRNAAIDRARYG